MIGYYQSYSHYCDIVTAPDLNPSHELIRICDSAGVLCLGRSSLRYDAHAVSTLHRWPHPLTALPLPALQLCKWLEPPHAYAADPPPPPLRGRTVKQTRTFRALPSTTRTQDCGLVGIAAMVLWSMGPCRIDAGVRRSHRFLQGMDHISA